LWPYFGFFLSFLFLPGCTAEEIETVDTQSATSFENGEEKSATRPTHLFAASSSSVTFSQAIPIIETPSTQHHPDLAGPDNTFPRAASPVELTEEQPDYQDQSLAETEIEAVVEEPLSRKGSAIDVRARSSSGGSTKSGIVKYSHQPK
jgi:hypothetical protein